MRSSILIAFLVVAISSSTYGNDNIFGVKIIPEELHTLNVIRVREEIQAKLDLEKQIEDFSRKVPAKERCWLCQFKKLIKAEREIIEKLSMPLSQMNTDGLDYINDDKLKGQIAGEVYTKLEQGLDTYMKMLKTFDFSQTVWEGRTFLGNPFEEFINKTLELNPEALKASTLYDAFKQAATEVRKAKKAIFETMSSFKSTLEPQNRKSQKVMCEIRHLNLLAVPRTGKNVKKSVQKLSTKLENLLSSIENINNIPPVFQCFMEKRAWLDEIRTQLNNIDKTHSNLNIKLAGL